MSSTYTRTAITPTQRIGPRADRRRGHAAVGAVVAGVAAVGAAVAIYFASPEVPAAPAVPAPAASLAPWSVSVEDASTAPPERLMVALPNVGSLANMAIDASTAPPERLPIALVPSPALLPAEDASTAPPERLPADAAQLGGALIRPDEPIVLDRDAGSDARPFGSLVLLDPGDPDSSAAPPTR